MSLDPLATTNKKPSPKKTSAKKTTALNNELTVDNVKEILIREINKLNGVTTNNTSPSLSLTQIASRYLKSFNDLRAYCAENPELHNAFIILSKLQVDNMYTDIIKSGKLTPALEKYMRDTMQMYSVTPFNQNVTIIESPISEDFEVDQDIDKTQGETNNILEYAKQVHDA